MTAADRQQQLVNARRACLMLVPLASDDPAITAQALILSKQAHGEQIADLIDQFARLDAAEQRANAARQRNARGESASGKRAGKRRLSDVQLTASAKRSRKARA